MFAPSFSFDVEIDHVVKVEGPHKGFLLLVDEGFVEGMHGWVSVLEIEVWMCEDFDDDDRGWWLKTTIKDC